MIFYTKKISKFPNIIFLHNEKWYFVNTNDRNWFWFHIYLKDIDLYWKILYCKNISEQEKNTIKYYLKIDGAIKSILKEKKHMLKKNVKFRF